ncbi:MAG: hypothetical protein Q9218_003590 [Villophora microphyllina]
MQKENGHELERPLGRSKGLKELTLGEVQNVMRNAIESIIENWKQKRLPKLQQKAWMLWSKSRRNNTKHTRISSLEYDVQHLNSRLDKLRNEIAREQWISVKQIVKQCESMRRTIEDLQECEWTIETLRLNVRPEKPEESPMIKSQRKQDNEFVEEEELEAGLGTVETPADEDLDDFIVDDDVESGIVEDGDQLINDEDTTTDDAASSYETQPLANNDTRSRMLSPQTTEASASLIDLTLESDGSDAETVPRSTPVVPNGIKISPTKTADSFEESSQRIERKKAQFRSPPGLEKFRSFSATPTAPSQLPPLSDTDSIRGLNPTVLMERADRKRLLIYLLANTAQHRRKKAYAWLGNRDIFRAKDDIWLTLRSMTKFRTKIKGIVSHAESETMKKITGWFISWTNVIVINKEKGANQEQMKTAADDKKGFEPFHTFLVELRCLADYKKGSKTSDSDSCELVNSQPTPSKRRGSLINYSDDELQTTAKKRKYAVPESQEAAIVRKKAHQRVEDREERQTKLKKALQRMGQTEENPSQVVINLGKLDYQDLIYLPDSIGKKIQPHQKDGLRFLWREIIEDHASKQGALLAQTMGLGKTMQVISFLITVAKAARSTIENTRNQIPPRLRESKTLVICPPSLVANWEEEFFQWAPNDLKDDIGDIRTVSSAMPLTERLRTAREWGDEGGVLLIGSSMLTALVMNTKKRTMGSPPLSEEQHTLVKDILLKGPNIVILDEAHTAKNRTSDLNKIMMQFKTGSRIALTGSPLSNNLSEYYALIEWIAPGYLGEPREFVYRYEEPIKEGLYSDSTDAQWRLGLKRLELFKREVNPKIHRADISVLASRLKGKSEFVIKVAATELQQRLYETFVESMQAHLPGAADRRASQATLWASVSKLRLVCNHPWCFYENLTEKEPKETKKRKHDQSVADGETKDDDEANEDADLGLSDSAIRHQLTAFDGLTVPLDSITLAYKMTLLLQIVELCKAVGDKILIFSHSLSTLNYIEGVLQTKSKRYKRMDGKVATQKRQAMTKEFNREDSIDVFLISTRAGGTGLNLFGANRVIIVDDHWNPTHEEQAIGRAYRIGQSKHVFVYRLTVGGTFEEVLHNQSLFKQQLATRAVDKRNIARLATRNAKDYFRPLQPVEQTNFEQSRGEDPHVLDYIIDTQASKPFIRAIVPCETFQQEVEEKLTADEQREVEEEEATSRLRRTDPDAYYARIAKLQADRAAQQAELFAQSAANVNSGNIISPVAWSNANIPNASVISHPNASIVSYSTDMPPPSPRSFTAPSLPADLQSLRPPTGTRCPHSAGPDGLDGSSETTPPWPIDPNPHNQWMTGEEIIAAAVRQNDLPVLGANTMIALDTVASSEAQAADKSIADGTDKILPSCQTSDDMASVYGYPPKGTFTPYPPLQKLLSREAERLRQG